MTTGTLRGVVRGRTIVLENGQELPVGTEVLVTVAEDPPGSPAAILKAVREAPHLDPEDVEELRRAIKAGRSPVDYSNPLLRRKPPAARSREAS